VISRSGIKEKTRGSNYLPYSATFIIFFLAVRSYITSFLPPIPARSPLSVTFMGKRRSIGAAAGTATKRAKTVNADPPTVGNWVQTKVQEKELQSVKKIGLLKNDQVETLAAGPEIIPRPPAGFQVIFLAFLLRLSLPSHPFLHGHLFAYRIQLHDLNPNTILHIA
jgi:hypothetical protein